VRAEARCWFWGGAATAGIRPALRARPLADALPAAGGRCRLPAWSPPLRRYRGKTEPSWRSSRAGLQLRSIAGGEPRVIGASAWIFGCVRSAGGVDPFFPSLLRSLSLSQSLPICSRTASASVLLLAGAPPLRSPSNARRHRGLHVRAPPLARVGRLIWKFWINGRGRL